MSEKKKKSHQWSRSERVIPINPSAVFYAEIMDLLAMCSEIRLELCDGVVHVRWRAGMTKLLRQPHPKTVLQRLL
jgi:hypothetical protein